MRTNLSDRQAAVLDYIVGYVSRDPNGMSPTYQTIADAMELASLATVAKHVESLVDKGYINRVGQRKRGLTISCSIPANLVVESILRQGGNPIAFAESILRACEDRGKVR